jgi:hypothetical protein
VANALHGLSISFLMGWMLGSVSNVFSCANCTEPGSHVRILKAKRCSWASRLDVPIGPRVAGDAIGFSSQSIQFLAVRLLDYAVIHLAHPPTLNICLRLASQRDLDQGLSHAGPEMAAVCTENLVRVDDMMESPKLAE